MIYYWRGNVGNKAEKISMTVNITHFLHFMPLIFVWEQSAASLSQWDVTGYRVLPPSKPNDVPGVGFPWQNQVGFFCGRDELLPLLARTLLFFLPHLLPQLLTDISQRVHFGREGLYCLAEPDGLRFTTMTAKHRRRVMWLLNAEDADRAEQQRRKKVKTAAYRSLRFCDCFIWLKSVGSVLFTGLKGGDTKHWSQKVLRIVFEPRIGSFFWSAKRKRLELNSFKNVPVSAVTTVDVYTCMPNRWTMDQRRSVTPLLRLHRIVTPFGHDNREAKIWYRDNPKRKRSCHQITCGISTSSDINLSIH